MTLPNLNYKVAAIISALSFYSGAVSAQVVPGAADPARSRSTTPVLQAPQPLPELTSPAISRSSVNVTASQQQFVLKGVAIDGMNVYYPEDFSVLYADLIGKKTSVAAIQKVADQITQQYRLDGFVLATAGVPNQTIDSKGVITIKVNEGRIAKVVYDGQQPQDNLRGLVDTYANKIRDMNPPKADELERYLLLINDLPGNTARALLRPSTTEPGATDLVISYAHKYIDGAATIENRGSKYLGPWQGSVTVAANSVLGMDERTVFRFLTSSDFDEMKYFEAQHEQQLGNEGTRVQFNASHAESNPGDVLKPLEIEGTVNNFRAFVYHPFIRSRLQNFTARGGLDVQNVSTDILNTRFSEDKIRSVRVGGQYDLADSLDGVNQLDLQFSRGLNMLGATKNGAGRTRINGEQEYSKINFDLARTQALPASFSLFAAFSSQYAFDPLLTSEQFVLGGPRFGSAYDPGELSGDHGAAGRLELRYGDNIGKQFLESYQLYGFFDAGTVWLKSPLASEEDSTSLSSAGAGVRTNFTPNLAGSFEVAKPLSKKVAVENDKDTRFFTNLTARF